MTLLEFRSKNVEIVNGNLQIDAYLAQPVGDGKFPGIVVFQEIFGVNAHIREIVDRIAQQGYVAIAPALYQRTAPGFETGYTDADFKLGRSYKAQTKASELRSDTQAAIDYLKAMPNTTSAIGTIGFCFGGHVAYLVATLPDIKATASCYGAGIATSCPGEEGTTLDRTSEIGETLYGFFGTADPLIPLEQVDRIEAELKKHNIPHQIFRYEGADHGFMCDRRSSYNPTAAADAWQQIWQLFESTLKV
ncbi:dienelactone hydrolase family protein [Oscillatoriales cyanobacterium LEGE 11467]|uniref:Dienelactone hydrolase family protein n=1 Tax=Zarconia navalis LEGE 11467 TaxID=1828826 RepID=A0A928W1S9_9CYAN|nr:dienelactone hydrolase family protein [Zarconia navalis]MBE9042406.1 dienelactone hydrolase family protein [Zarconia navalis LEGE 11467]